MSGEEEDQGGDGKDDLPLVDWEVPDQRKRVPKEIRLITGAISSIVRMDQDTYAKQRRKHRDTLAEYEGLSRIIQRWEFFRKQLPEESRAGTDERWQFVQFIQRDDDEAPWPLLTVLEKLGDGSLKLVTTHRRQQAWVKHWVQRGDVQRRGQQ